MTTKLIAGITSGTALNVITDTTGAMEIQTTPPAGTATTAIAISAAQAVTLTNPLPAGSGGTGISSLGTGVATALGQNVTGSGGAVLATSPSIASPTLTGTPIAPTAAAGTNTTQVATTAFVLANSAPTGGLIMWGTGTAPSGWLLCAGGAVSRTTYAALFAVIGTTFGVGDGSTTFTLPNYTNRMPYGTTVAATGGSADAVVVSHTHTATVTDPGHAHSGGATGALLPVNNVPYYNFNQQGNTGSQVTGISVSNSTEGVSGTNANLPPYLGINFIIKT